MRLASCVTPANASNYRKVPTGVQHGSKYTHFPDAAAFVSDSTSEGEDVSHVNSEDPDRKKEQRDRIATNTCLRCRPLFLNPHQIVPVVHGIPEKQAAFVPFHSPSCSSSISSISTNLCLPRENKNGPHTRQPPNNEPYLCVYSSGATFISL